MLVHVAWPILYYRFKSHTWCIIVTDGFIRQRRNLMIISLFLLIYDFAEIQIAKVSLLGTELVVGRPEILEWTAWAIWGYLLLRYTQYLIADEASPVFSGFNEARRKILQGTAQRHFSEQYTSGTRVQPHFGGRRWSLLGWRATLYHAGRDGGHTRAENVVGSWEVPLANAALIAAKALYRVTFYSTAVTDVVFPFALAVVAPLVYAMGFIWK